MGCSGSALWPEQVTWYEKVYKLCNTPRLCWPKQQTEIVCGSKIEPGGSNKDNEVPETLIRGPERGPGIGEGVGMQMCGLTWLTHESI